MTSHDDATLSTRRIKFSRAQFYFWYVLNRQQSQIQNRWNMAFRVRLPDGVSAEQAATAARLLAHRHDGLRSSIDESCPEPVQVVHPVSRLQLSHREIPDDDEQTLESCERDLVARDMDLESGQSVRGEIITIRGQPCWMVLVVHHLFVAHGTLLVIRNELLTVLNGLVAGGKGDESLPPVDTVDDRMRYESSERGVIRARRGNEYLAKQLSKIPNVSFPYKSENDGRPGAMRVLTMYSRALLRVVYDFSRRLNVSPCSIVLAAGDIVLSSYTGYDAAWSVSVSKAPVHPGRVLIECPVQTVPIYPRLGQENSLLGAIKKSQQGLLMANYYGDHDYAQYVEDLADDAMRRSTRVESIPLFNCFAASILTDEAFDGGDARSLAQLRRSTRYTWDEVADPRAAVALECWDQGPELRLTLWSGGGLIRSPDMVRFLQAIESLLCQLATDGDIDLVQHRTALQSGGWPRDADLTPLDADTWVDPAATEQVLARHPSVRTACVDIVRDEDGFSGQLVANVEAVRPVPTPDEMRAFGLGRLRGPGVVIPSQFEIVEVPRDGHAEHPVVDCGDASAEESLYAVIEAVLGTRPVAADLSFRQQGGRARFVPAIKRRLERDGWSCSTVYDDLLGLLPVREVAARIRPGRDRSRENLS